MLVVCPAVRREIRLTSHTRPAKRDQAQQGAAVSVSIAWFEPEGLVSVESDAS